ncbi:E3 ubiquitin-protein ligase TRAIP-like [Glandiceps talaboti]
MVLHAYCSICSDLYETDSNISATTCGHVFHENCLQRWTNQSKTCPQCRADCFQRNIVRRLYLETSEDVDKEVDPSSLKNELDKTKALLSQNKKEKADLKKDKERLYDQISVLEGKIGDLMDRANEAESTNSALKKQLKILSYRQDEAEKAKKEARDLRNKLKRLERFEAVMLESSREVEEMLQNYGTGPHAVKDLATYCASLKKEFETSKQSRRKLRDELEEVKRHLHVKNKKLIEKIDETCELQRQLKLTEEDLQHSEDEKKSLKKKVSALQRAVESPSGAKGVISRLAMESPAPQTFKRPRLSGPIDENDFDLEMTPGFPETPEVIKPSPSVKAKKVCQEFGVPFIKTTSIAKANQQVKQESKERTALSSMIATSDLFKKRQPGDQDTSSIRKGYNGLGGHHTFIETREYAFGPTRKIAKPTKRKNVRKPDASLRTLKNFISQK